MREYESGPALRGPLTLAACIVQSLCALALLVRYWNKQKRSLLLELCCLLLAVCDSFRTHTLWSLASGATLTVPALQTTATVLYASLLATLSWPARESHSSTQNVEVVSREGDACLLSLLFLAWLNPLLSYGLKHNVTQQDMDVSEIHRNAVYATPSSTVMAPKKIGAQGTLFSELLQEMPLKTHLIYVGSLFLSTLVAGVTLCQPLIISSLIQYLQGNQHPSVGAWLVFALFLE